MAIDRVNDPRAFREFLDVALADCGASLTLDEAFWLWEHENLPEEEHQEDLKAVKQALADIEAGRVRPIESFDREFRAKHGLSMRS